MRSAYHDRARQTEMQKTSRARVRAKAVEKPVIDPIVVVIGLLSLMTALILSFQTF